MRIAQYLITGDTPPAKPVLPDPTPRTCGRRPRSGGASGTLGVPALTPAAHRLGRRGAQREARGHRGGEHPEHRRAGHQRRRRARAAREREAGHPSGHAGDRDRHDRRSGAERGHDGRQHLERHHPHGVPGRPAQQADRRELVAALGRGHRRGVDQREGRERGGEPDDQPHAPRPVDVGRVDRVEVLGAAQRPHARDARPRSARATAGRPRRRRRTAPCRPRTAAWRRTTAGSSSDVPESGRAIVDRGDAERGGRRVGHPDGDGVADPQVDRRRRTRGSPRRRRRGRRRATPHHVGIERGRGPRPLRPAAATGSARRARRQRIDLGRHHRRRRRRRRASRRPRQRCPRAAARRRRRRRRAARDAGRVTSSVWRWLLDSTIPWMPASIATSMIGVASAAVRQRFAASPVPASSPDAPRRRSGPASTAAGIPSSQRPSNPVPMASRIPPSTANAIAQ